MTGGGGGGTGSDECTATLDHVLAGETAVTSDSNDEPGTGRMTVNSLLSFSVAAYSGRRVLLKWQNPYAAAGKPYSGVIIKASRGGYPAWMRFFQEQETMLPREPGHRRLWIYQH